jgi:hypothetical protein
LNKHVKSWPLETEPIANTATSLGGMSRTPDPTKAFVPVGHISLNAGGEDFVLEGSYKIAYFYVSTALQGGGLGRAAMDAVEGMAVSQPLCAKALWLSTTSNIQQDPPPAVDMEAVRYFRWGTNYLLMFNRCLPRVGMREEAMRSFRMSLVNGKDLTLTGSLGGQMPYT